MSKKKSKKKSAGVDSSSVIQPSNKKQAAKFAARHQQELQLAHKHEQAQQFANAEVIYLKIIETSPRYFDANYLLARLYRRAGANASAIPYMETAIQLQPTFFEGVCNLGELLRSVGRADEALGYFERAIKLQPNNPDAYNALGKANTDLTQLEQAVENFERALTLQPDHAEVHGNLGRALNGLGNIDAAEQSYRKALALVPNYAEAHRGLAYLRKHVEVSDDIRAMEIHYNDPSMPWLGRVVLGFSLAKAYEDLKDYEKSFEFLSEANRMKRQSFQHSTDAQAAYIDQHIEAFTADMLRDHQGLGLESSSPIFIVGMPRSGTSLAEQILASHSTVFGAGELQHLPTLSTKLNSITGQSFPQGLEQIKPQNWQELATDYLALTEKLTGDSPYFTDKLPHNFLRIGLINIIFPNAKIIHCKRDPMDNCLSIYKLYFSAGHSYASDLKDLGEYYLLYENLMHHWHKVLPGKIYDLQYEQMVADPDQQIRKLLDFCELPFEENCLSFHKTKRTVHTPSATQVRQPMYKGAVEFWRNYESQLQPLKQALGRD